MTRPVRGLISLVVAWFFLAPFAPAFVNFQPPRSVHRVPMKNVVSEERHLELPEVTHFVEEEAEGCLEEGCSVEEIEKIQHKLERDEGRIREEIEKLRVAREDYDVDSSTGIGMLRVALSRLHGLSEKLRRMLDAHGEQMAKDFGAYLAFGNGETGGFLTLKNFPQAA
mmetsp:Transcript_70674/g.111885  ORF Transcript_70674/g.111885 Transcript_70674/m.111885 type:complete len:168 (+) Transcript_70674:73-576(+)